MPQELSGIVETVLAGCSGVNYWLASSSHAVGLQVSGNGRLAGQDHEGLVLHALLHDLGVHRTLTAFEVHRRCLL